MMLRQFGKCVFVSGILAGSQVMAATSRQEEVFKAIQDNVSDQVSTDALIIFGVILLAGLIVAIVSVINKRQSRPAKASSINHPGKLMKEVLRTTGLRPADVKRLKILVERLEEEQGVRVKNPLTLMLCPSLLKKVIKDQSTAHS